MLGLVLGHSRPIHGSFGKRASADRVCLIKEASNAWRNYFESKRTNFYADHTIQARLETEPEPSFMLATPSVASRITIARSFCRFKLELAKLLSSLRTAYHGLVQVSQVSSMING